ncbi:MAG: C2H2-type zinc finger protein [Chlorobi bacterium]|nr:C2H2-type zinc finger protein [Chlorobiota bacterium]
MRLNVKFRSRNGIPFSIERLSGTQFRCGVCGKIFFNRTDLEKHLKNESYAKKTKPAFPELNENISVGVLYSQDNRDRTNSKYSRLHNGDENFVIDDK